MSDLIKPLEIPPEMLKPYFDDDKFPKQVVFKLNEVITVVNKMDPLIQSTLADDLHVLLQLWKNEAHNLRDHPEDYTGISKEACIAVSHRLLHCYTEVFETISGN